MNVVFQVVNPQHPHRDKFCQFLLDCLEISAHIHDLTVSVHFFGLDLGLKASGRGPLECQNSGVLMQDPIRSSSCFQSHFTLFLRD